VKTPLAGVREVPAVAELAELLGCRTYQLRKVVVE
jgi:hypothetical protein